MKSDGKHPAPCDLCGEDAPLGIALKPFARFDPFPETLGPAFTPDPDDVKLRKADRVGAECTRRAIEAASRLQTIKEIAA